jgi:PAS domain S-box-containing protein
MNGVESGSPSGLDRNFDETEARYKIIFDSAPLGIFTYSGDGHVLEANRFLLNLLGSPSPEATRKVNLFTFENLRKAGVSRMLVKTLETGRPQQLRTEYHSKWGKSVELDLVAYPLSSDESGPDRGMVIVHDMTAVRRIKDDLVAIEQRFRLLAENIPSAIALVERDGTLSFLNPSFRAMFGRASEDNPTLERWLEAAAPDEKSRGKLRDALRFDESGVDECRRAYLSVSANDGSSKTVLFSVSPIDRNTKLIALENITGVISAWEELNPADRNFQNLLDNLADIVFILDLDGTLLSINRAGARSLGYNPEEITGRSIKTIIPESAHKHVSGNMNRIRVNGFADGLSKYRGKDGSIHYLEYRSKRIKGEGRPDLIVGVARDVTRRIVAEKALTESEHKFQILVERAHDGIVAVDTKALIQFANPRMKEILADPNPEGKSLASYFDEENARTLWENLEIREEGGSSTYYVTVTDLESNRHDVVVSGTPYFDAGGKRQGAIGIYTDISELRKLEAKLLQAQKMEAIGTLAGGIAHDFNNILSGVLGYASLLNKQVEPDSPTGRYADMIEKSAERGAALAGQLLGFARKGRQIVEDVDVHELVDEVVDIFKRTLDRKVAVLTRKSAERSVIEGDPGQILQLLMNLGINANDAMPGGGRLLISTERVEADANFCRRHGGLTPGPYLQLTVEDNGEGMDEEVKLRLFEPFFTTKEEGKGTGLGLSMVYGTVKSHGGHIRVYSERGVGSTFIILLPLKTSAAEVEPEHDTSRFSAAGGTILVVDDEDVVRELLVDMLRELGFETISASDGLEGVRVYRERRADVDLVILDMVMPGLSGREAFREMKKISPDLKAILSTGFSRKGAVQATMEEGILGFIQKPYTLDQLSQAIYEVLTPDESTP